LHQLHIDPLAAASADELLDTLLGSDAGLLPIKKRLIEATQGNPLFLEECVRSLIENGVLDLQVAEFLYEKAPFPETEYAFNHSMTRQVAYASLLREQRMILHARAARSLEILAAGRLDEHVERLADHAERGAIWDKALEYLQRSGLKAYSLYANADAARFFERALKVLEKLPETPDNLRRAVDLRFELRNALLPSFETDRILRSLDEDLRRGVRRGADAIPTARFVARQKIPDRRNIR
jgi:predicted ATPase